MSYIYMRKEKWIEILNAIKEMTKTSRRMNAEDARAAIYTIKGDVNIDDVISGNMPYDERYAEVITGAETVKPYMFYNGTLEKFIGHNVTRIEEHAFSGCRYLETIELPAVDYIGEYAFLNDSRISGKLEFPNLSTLKNGAFMGTDIRSIKLPNIWGLDDDCLANIYYLNTVDLGNVRYINKAFDGSNMTNLVIRSTSLPTLNRDTMGGGVDNNRYISIYVPDNMVNEYKSDYTWGKYKEKIKPLSEYIPT